jgi:glycosyltransferase involved in cell wall biosynthesis
MPPTVSVTIPTFNRRHLLARCLDSVFAQTCGDMEIIIVDDGSTDDTPEYIKSLHCPFLQYIAVPHCGSLPRLRNIALANSSGAFVALMDSDDEWDPRKLEIQLSGMQASSLGMTFTDAVTIGRGDERRQRFVRYAAPFVDARDFPVLFREWFILTPSVVIRRNLIEAIGNFREDLVCTGDAEFFLRAVRHGRAGFIPEPLLIRHIQEDGHSHAHAVEAYREMLGHARDCYGDGALTFIAYHGVTSTLAYRLGLALRQAGDSGGARAAFRRSLYHNPSHLKAALQWISC